jgi:hypothetical protein
MTGIKQDINGVRHYEHPVTGEWLPSVTAVLAAKGVGFGLVNWYASQAAQYAVNSYDEWFGLPRDEAIKRISSAPRRSAERSAGVGTDAHAYAESLLSIPGEFELPAAPDEFMGGDNATDNVRAILTTLWPYEVVATECTVYSLTYGYAGTFDALLRIDGKLCLCDWKSNKRVYPEMALQQAGYRYADQILMSDGQFIDMPQVDETLILHIPKQGDHSIVSIKTGAPEFAAFLAIRQLFDWQQNHEPHVLQASGPTVPWRQS